MIKKSAAIKRSTFRLLTLLCSSMLAMHISSCACNNSGKQKGPKNNQERRTKDESKSPSKLEIKHDVTTNQITITVHNPGTAIASMQLDYTNISPDANGKTALLDGKPAHTLLVENIPAGDSKTITLPLDFREARETTFKFQVQQDGAETITVNKTFPKPTPQLILKLLERKNSVGLYRGEFSLYYRITQTSDKLAIDQNKLSLKIINQGLNEENAIFYNNQKITELQLPGTALNEVEAAMDRLPITLGPSTTSVSLTLQLFYEDIPMGEPKAFTWQANHSGPTQALFDTIFTNDLGKTAEILATNPALIYATDEKGHTALHKALEKNNIDKNLIQLLLDKGAKLDAQDKGVHVENQLVYGGNTPLHTALENENITPEIIDLLLSKDPSMVKVKTKSGDSLLHTAARNEKMTKEMIDLLISKGADPSVKCDYNNLPVMRAANGGNLETFERLFEITPGIDVNTKDKDGHTLLQRAMWMDSVDVMEWLLDKPGIDVTPPVSWGYGNKSVPLLHEAVGSYRSPEVIELLLQKLGNVDIQDEENNTPLLVAVKEYIKYPRPNHFSIVEVLLKHNADKDLPNRQGITPRQLVEASTHEELKKLFRIPAH